MPILVQSKDQAARFYDRRSPDEIAAAQRALQPTPVRNNKDLGFPAKARSYPLKPPFIQKDKTTTESATEVNLSKQDQEIADKLEKEKPSGIEHAELLLDAMENHEPFVDIAPGQTKWLPDFISTDSNFEAHLNAGTLVALDYEPAPTPEELELAREITARKQRESKLEEKLGHLDIGPKIQEELEASRKQTDELIGKHRDIRAKAKEQSDKQRADERSKVERSEEQFAPLSDRPANAPDFKASQQNKNTFASNNSPAVEKQSMDTRAAQNAPPPIVADECDEKVEAAIQNAKKDGKI